MVAEKVERCYKVTPLDKFTQWTTVVSILSKLEPSLVRQSTNMNENLSVF